jgi:transposase
MAMGTRQDEQAPLWIATSELRTGPGHPFYTRLNAVLDAAGFDRYVEDACRRFYAPRMGRPGLAPGRYFRMLLVGYVEGLDSERGIAWRAADSLAIRRFLHVGLEDATPDHSTISRTRHLIDVETHRAVFTWVQAQLVTHGLLTGRPSRWTRRRWKPMPPCAASCGAIPARRTRPTSHSWPPLRGSRHPHARRARA